MTKEDAREIVKTIKKEDILAIGETDNAFVFCLNNDEEGYVTVDKNTKETGFLWIWDFGDLYRAGKAKWIERYDHA